MAALHANIEDQFNEHGVRIMSPTTWATPPGPRSSPGSVGTPRRHGERSKRVIG